MSAITQVANQGSAARHGYRLERDELSAGAGRRRGRSFRAACGELLILAEPNRRPSRSRLANLDSVVLDGVWRMKGDAARKCVEHGMWLMKTARSSQNDTEGCSSYLAAASTAPTAVI
jgi:hypothetical protein